jgi:protein-S-isoprenylcysteine O-methyltransferase Ste14
MTDDSVFRWVMVCGALTVLPFAVYHRWKSITDENLDRRQEGSFILLTLRPLAAFHFVGLLAYLIDPKWMSWSALPLPTWLRWIGVGIGAASGLLIIWTFRNLGTNLTDTVVTRRDHTLVTTGPYRWVRHPFYCAFGLAVAANSLVAANWFLLVSGAVAFALLAVRSTTEEANLLKRFGAEYEAYRARTGKFWPRR